MKPADQHPDESLRLAALLRYEVLDTEHEQHFDELTELASLICGTPISLISLVDKDRQWFKSKVGLEADETPRDIAFCSHAILQSDVFEVPNAKLDDRFHDNPLVTGNPDIRFYAGAPLVTSDGMPIGTLCVIDQQPQALNEMQKRAMQIIANQVVNQLELRLHNKRLTQLNNESEKLFSLIAHDLRSPFNGILGLTQLLSDENNQFSAREVADFSRQILSSSTQVYQLLDELLQWAQQRLSDDKIDPGIHQLVFLIKDAVQTVDAAKQAKQQTINLELDNPGIQAMCDAVATKTVIRNLLSNAVKFSPVESTITVSVDAKDEQVVISVADQGRGIDECVRQGLFSQNVTSQLGSKGEKGIGLGLRLSAELVRRQGGNIWVAKSDASGTTFSFSLPSA
ncbi:GAF domain-containing sensor histidine kinase [Salinibius halmophilus]|uniref:GAF domain-containing sensor histidine kinase n=1 Tax=Salinibius halmophilus TaxID=1853216 RepID=UPI000E66C07A|nr:GAF domain-containing sensor histidine kinase [Salinibius halmophilus]